MDVTLDHFRLQVVIHSHQQRAVVIPRPPEGTGIKAPIAIGPAVVKPRQLRVARVIADFPPQQAVGVGQPDAAAQCNDKPALLAQGKTADLLWKLQHLVFSAADIVAVNFTFHDISPVEGLFCLAPGRAFRQVSGVVKQRLWFSHRCHPYKKSQRSLALLYTPFSLYCRLSFA